MGINKSIEKKGSGHSILLIKDLYSLILSFVSIFNIETQLYKNIFRRHFYLIYQSAIYSTYFFTNLELKNNDYDYDLSLFAIYYNLI